MAAGENVSTEPGSGGAGASQESSEQRSTRQRRQIWEFSAALISLFSFHP